MSTRKWRRRSQPGWRRRWASCPSVQAPRRPGYFVPPTVLSEVAPDDNILKEEIFGPIAPIVTFRDVNQAIEFANKTDRGLAAYVFTGDLAKGLAIAEA